jgi:hypothetical protein
VKKNSVFETAPSDIPKTNEIDGVAKLAPSVNETAPPEDFTVPTDTPAAASATTPVQPKKKVSVPIPSEAVWEPGYVFYAC